MSSSAALACTAKDILHAHAVLHLCAARKAEEVQHRDTKGVHIALDNWCLMCFVFPLIVC